jgi:hypothetical protein
LVWSTNYNSATATVVAVNPGNPTQPIVFGYEAGSMMASEYATTRHVGLGLHKDVRANLTASGWALFDAAVAWAAASAYVAPPPPGAPTNLSATAGDMQVSLSWNSVAGATSYSVKRSTTSGGPYSTIVSGHTTTSYIDSSLTNGSTYYYVVSASNAEGESANSAQVSATPVEGGSGGGVTRLGLFVTASELDVWRLRAVEGPYKSLGDVSTNSPGDWDVITTNRNYFNSNSIPIWSPTLPYTEPRDYIPHHTDANHVSKIQCAAFHALVTEDLTMGSSVMTWLYNQATEASADFSDPNWFPTNAHPDTVFRPSEYVAALMTTYDYARILGVGSSTQHNAIRQWFSDAIDWGTTIQFEDVGAQGFWTNRWTLSVNSSADIGTDTAYTHNDGWMATRQGKRYNNRKTCGILMGVLGGLILGQDPSDTTSGLARGKQWIKEWMVMQLHPDYDIQEMYRGSPSMTTNSEVGWSYTGQILGDLFQAAEALARAGDNELYTFTTRAGIGGTQCQSGDPDKSLLTAAQAYARYGNDVHSRYQGAVTSANRVDGRKDRNGSEWRGQREILLSIGNKYWQSNELMAAYMRDTSAGFAPYWSSPTAPVIDRAGGRAGFPGVLFMFGQTEDINVYPTG